MGGYCTVSDVKNYFQNMKFGPDSALSEEKVNYHIEKYSIFIDHALSPRYNLKTLSTDKFAMAVLKEICALFVSHEMLRISGAAAKDIEKPGNNREQAQKWLEDILAGIKPLVSMAPIPSIMGDGEEIKLSHENFESRKDGQEGGRVISGKSDGFKYGD